MGIDCGVHGQFVFTITPGGELPYETDGGMLVANFEFNP